MLSISRNQIHLFIRENKLSLSIEKAKLLVSNVISEQLRTSEFKDQF